MRRFFCLLVFLLLIGWVSFAVPAYAAGITVETEGVSDVLTNEFISIAGQVEQFYQEVYNYTPAKTVKIVIVADEAAYASKLQSEGYSQADAIRLAKSSSGVSLANRAAILIPADKNTRYLQRIQTMTHEMFHQMQSEFRKGIPGHNWLIEGSAKISEVVLLEWLDKGSMASYRFNLVNQLTNVKLAADPGDLIDGGFKWTNQVEQKMYPYQVSELATDFLMRRNGKNAIVNYFRILGETHDRETAFQKAFGVSHGQFLQEYRTYMAGELKNKGRIVFEGEGEVNSEVYQTFCSNGAIIDKLLKDQGWKPEWSQRIILVPDQETMLKVLSREQPLFDKDRLGEIAQKATIAGIGGYSYVLNAGKTDNMEQKITPMALMLTRAVIMMNAKPAMGTSIYWLYEGTAEVLAAESAGRAGTNGEEGAREEWVNVVAKANGYPALSDMKGSLSSSFARYGKEVVNATVALAAERLREKVSPDALLRYFTVLRDLNDAPRAFQQVFGMTQEVFSSEFGEYLRTLREE